MDLEILRARLADAAEMAPHMRAADAAEVVASGGYTPKGALEDAILMSGSAAWTARHRGRIMAIYGVAPVCLLSGVVVPWVLTTDLVDRYPKTFFKTSRQIVADLRQQYTLMTNMVDARYVAALRWVSRLGFEVGQEVPYGINGQKFNEIKLKGA